MTVTRKPPAATTAASTRVPKKLVAAKQEEPPRTKANRGRSAAKLAAPRPIAKAVPKGQKRNGRKAAPAGNTADQLTEDIGRSIRNRRVELGITMSELATTADLSQPFLSKVERGLGRLSMGALDRVARALGTSAVGLLAGSDAPATVDVVRKGERPKLRAYENDEGMGQALTRRSGQLRVVEFDSGPMDFALVPYVHRNDSVCVVLSGEYEFEFDQTRLTLTEGDSVSSSGGVSQRYRVLRRPARLLLILVSEDVDVVPHRHVTPGKAVKQHPRTQL